MFRNEHLDDDDWTLAINWGDNTPKIAEFHLDDPSLLVLQSEATKIQGILFHSYNNYLKNLIPKTLRFTTTKSDQTES